MGAEGSEVFHRQGAASRLHIRCHAARQIAFIEIPRPPLRQMGQGGSEPVLRQAHVRLDAPLRIGRQTVDEIGRRARGITPQVGCRAGNHEGGPPVHGEPLVGQTDAGTQQFLPGQFAVAPMGFFHARHYPGHGDRARAVKIAIVPHARPRENVGGGTIAGQRIVLGTEAAGRSHAVVDHFVAVFARAIENHRAAAADATHPGLQYAQRESGCDHGIYAVSASRHDLGADFGCLARLGGDDSFFGNHGRFADLLGVAELVTHGVAFAVSRALLFSPD